MNTYRALCTELLQPLAEYDSANPYHEHRDLITRASAELAQPEAEGLSLAEVDELCAEFGFHLNDDRGESLEILQEMIGAALARWGHPTTQPTSVSERPWERDGWCDAQGTCWMWHPVNFHYCLCRPDPSVHTHSLPHWALPLPTTEEAGELSPREVEAQEAFTEMRDEILSRSDGLTVNEVPSVIDSFTPGWV